MVKGTPYKALYTYMFIDYSLDKKPFIRLISPSGLHIQIPYNGCKIPKMIIRNIRLKTKSFFANPI